LSATFRREGEYWVIRYKTPVFRLKDRMGLRYLALLLKHPGREFLAIDLVAAVQGGRGGSIPDDGAERVTLGGHEPHLDEQARREYAQRLQDLHAVVEEAHAFNDRERASRAEAEIDLLTDELRRGIGLRQLTDVSLDANHPVFSPDGKLLAFSASQPGWPITARGIAVIEVPNL
jgi:WD40 repeat protein